MDGLERTRAGASGARTIAELRPGLETLRALAVAIGRAHHGRVCGRARIIASADAIGREFQVEIDFGNIRRRFNLAPTQPMAVIREPGRLTALRWGFVHVTPDDRRGGPGGINVRGESVTRAPIYRESFARRRCLAVVDGFYEWKRSGSSKQPFLVTETDDAPFSLGAIWDSSVTPDGVVIEAVGIITVPSVGEMAAIHDRMPLFVPRAQRETWLLGDRKDAAALLAPTSFSLHTRPVSSWVNNAAHDDARCNDAPDAAAPSGKPATPRARRTSKATSPPTAEGSVGTTRKLFD